MKAIKRGKQWQITYRCPNYPKPINEYFESEEEANLRIAQVELEKKRGTLVPPSRFINPDRDRSLYRETITVRQLMEEFVTLYGLNHWSESTLSCNRHRIDDYILPYIGEIKVKALTTHLLEQFYQNLLTEPAKRTKGHENDTSTVSHSVIEKVHALIRSALNQAIRWDYLRGVNPALAVELPRRKKTTRATWDEEESRKALLLCTDPILQVCMYLALGCSMRVGEILGLTWDCVHMEDSLVMESNAYLTVEKELRRCSKTNLEALREKGRDETFFTFPAWKKTESKTVLVLKTPKTESSVRNIYLPNAVVEVLKRTKARQESLKADSKGKYQDFSLVVTQNNGRPMEAHIVSQKLKTLCDTYGLKRIVFHSLRHSSTSMKLKYSEGNVKAVQGDTGHAQSNMVTDVYAHIMNNDRRRLAQQMDKQFFASISPPETKTAPAPPPMDDSMRQLMQMLNDSPELAEPLLQMSKIFREKSS
jgi:integrase